MLGSLARRVSRDRADPRGLQVRLVSAGLPVYPGRTEPQALSGSADSGGLQDQLDPKVRKYFILPVPLDNK